MYVFDRVVLYVACLCVLFCVRDCVCLYVYACGVCVCCHDLSCVCVCLSCVCACSCFVVVLVVVRVIRVFVCFWVVFASLLDLLFSMLLCVLVCA